MKHRNRRHVTLIELLIALTLMSILITALLGFYSYVETSHADISEVRAQNFQFLYTQSRFNATLQRAILKRQNETFWFYTTSDGENPELVFVYDNGVDGDPTFASFVLGKLYIDADNRLCLATWPLPKHNFDIGPPMRKEVLLRDVDAIKFSFYRPPRRDIEERRIDIAQDSEYNQWHQEWPTDSDALPAIARVTVTLKEKKPTVSFTYVLPYTKDTILYHR